MQLILDFIWGKPVLSLSVQFVIVLALSVLLWVRKEAEQQKGMPLDETTQLSSRQRLELEIDRFWDDQDAAIEIHSGLHRRLYDADSGKAS